MRYHAQRRRGVLAAFSGQDTRRGRRVYGNIQLSACRSALILLVLGACFAAPLTARADETTTRFLWEEANARMATAKTSDDYLAAARTYNRLVQEGIRNGPLFFNLGTALLLAGDAHNAVAALLRAERFEGCTADIRTNLRLAIAASTGHPDADLPWSRVAFFWHFDHPLRIRLLVALGGWSLLWLGLLLRLLTRDRTAVAPDMAPSGAAVQVRALAGSCLFFGTLLGVVFGASVAVSLLQEHMQNRTWSERVFVSRPTQEHTT